MIYQEVFERLMYIIICSDRDQAQQREIQMDMILRMLLSRYNQPTEVTLLVSNISTTAHRPAPGLSLSGAMIYFIKTDMSFQQSWALL